MSAPLTAPPRAPWRVRLHTVIFGHETTAGKAFDVALLVAIVASVGAVMADSVPSLRSTWGTPLRIAEWTFTLLFSIEYVLRLACAERPTRYATSFFGLIDLAALLPTYLSLVAPGSQYLIVIRGLRVLRVFRILALAEYVGEAEFLVRALRDSRRKIAIFMATVATLTVMLGTLMYLIEGERSGFTSIPTSIYWTIVTITTVGYGDITPQTPFGQSLAAVIMLLGYAIVAIPTGIVTAELGRGRQRRVDCPRCPTSQHALDAAFCRRCGEALAAEPPGARDPSTTPARPA